MSVQVLGILCYKPAPKEEKKEEEAPAEGGSEETDGPSNDETAESAITDNDDEPEVKSKHPKREESKEGESTEGERKEDGQASTSSVAGAEQSQEELEREAALRDLSDEEKGMICVSCCVV